VAWRVGRGFRRLVLAGVGFTFVRDGGTSTMDEVPWLLVLLVALMVSMALAGISLFRAPNHAAIFVLLRDYNQMVDGYNRGANILDGSVRRRAWRALSGRGRACNAARGDRNW
jgi:hypothetical protein